MMKTEGGGAAYLDAITPAWLNTVLAGTLGKAHVVAVKTARVGTGHVGDSFRLTLDFDRPTDAPASLVVKLPSADPTSRAASVAMRTYEVETGFYRELARDLKIRTPHCYYVAYEPAADEFVLLLEDLAPARQGDQLAGCSIDQAVLAVQEMPKLHAPFWGNPKLAAIPWLNRGGPAGSAGTATLVGSLFDGFRDRYADRLDSDVLELAERLIPRLPGYFANRPGAWTIMHGDFRLDNLMFGTDLGGPPIAVLDWQTAAHGPGISDLSYFIGASLMPDARRRHETDLVRLYYESLIASGVDGLGWDQCWTEYRRYTFAGLVMAIAASMLVMRNARGDEMFIAMAQRHGRQALDLESEKLLI
ncbi:MAG TPA: phosphotransferase [Candidatus Binataceae bacterium]|nr:phosphotransferase [Candidatus Binataceae bacterium]